MPDSAAATEADRQLDFHPAMGERWEITRSIEDTAGEVFESTVWFDPRMPGSPPHVHPNSEESLEVIEGSFDVSKDGQWTTLQPGATVTVPPACRIRFATGPMRRRRLSSGSGPQGGRRRSFVTCTS